MCLEPLLNWYNPSTGEHMAKKKVRKPVRKAFVLGKRGKIFLGVLSVLIVLGLASMFTGTQLENHNSFCASCHTQDEYDYYQQSLLTTPVDLASVHESKQQARCIDCHTGRGVLGRVGGLMAGSTDLISYFSGHYPQPAAMEEPFSDENCLKCHDNVFAKQDMNNHFHFFLRKWQSADPANAARCVSCHGGHDKTGTADIAFLNKDITTAICQKCHAFAGTGE